MKRKMQQAQKLPILSFFKEATLETCIVNLLLKRKETTSVLHRRFISLLLHRAGGATHLYPQQWGDVAKGNS